MHVQRLPVRSDRALDDPGVRNDSLVASCLHDGGAAALRDVVDATYEFQLGHEAPDEDEVATVAIIKTLAGESKELPQ